MNFRIQWSGRAHDYTSEEIQTVVHAMQTADPQTQGSYLNQFEKDFAKFINQEPCFGVSNCANALELIADLLKLTEQDEVIVPAHTYCATAIPFGRKGARLRWADIDPETFLVSLDSIKSLVTPRTKAIIVVHLYGMMCDVEAIADFARSKGIALVEDCAQSIGARKGKRYAGTFGDFGAFSFHGQKNITTMGEGGMLTLKDPALAKLVPGLRHNGHIPFQNKKEYWLPAMVNVDVDIDGIWPHNFSLGEVQAALGSQLLKRVDALSEDRRQRARHFREALSEFPELVFQKEKEPESHVYHLLPARYDGRKTQKTRDDLLKLLSEKYGIKAIVQYYPLYRYDLFKKMGFAETHCPHTDTFFDNMLSFPFQHWMSSKDLEYVIQSTKAALLTLRGHA